MTLKDLKETIQNKMDNHIDDVVNEMKQIITNDLENNYKYKVTKRKKHPPYIKEIEKTDKKLIDQTYNKVEDIFDELTGENPHYSTSRIYYESKYKDDLYYEAGDVIDSILEEKYNTPEKEKELIILMGKYGIRFINCFDDALQEIYELPGVMEIHHDYEDKIFDIIKELKIIKENNSITLMKG